MIRRVSTYGNRTLPDVAEDPRLVPPHRLNAERFNLQCALH